MKFENFQRKNRSKPTQKTKIRYIDEFHTAQNLREGVYM